MSCDPDSFSAQSVGHIAAHLPGATGVLLQFDIDLRTHGEMTLQEAADRRGLDLEQITDALAALDTSAGPEAPQETSALIEHIQTRYRETHRRQLPELLALSRKVETVHADHPEVPAGLADLLEQMIGDMEVHMKKEELILFPAMRNRSAGGLGAPISQMRHDHDDHDRDLQHVHALTGGCIPPEDACQTWQALYAGLAQFKADLTEHIHLENNILFPRFEGIPHA